MGKLHVLAKEIVGLASEYASSLTSYTYPQEYQQLFRGLVESQLSYGNTLHVSYANSFVDYASYTSA